MNHLDNSVQMLKWNVKCQAQCEGILCLTFHSISVCTHCSKKSQNADKKFFCGISDHQSSVDSLVYMYIQTSTWIRKWILNKCFGMKCSCAKLDCDIYLTF